VIIRREVRLADLLVRIEVNVITLPAPGFRSFRFSARTDGHIRLRLQHVEHIDANLFLLQDAEDIRGDRACDEVDGRRTNLSFSRLRAFVGDLLIVRTVRQTVTRR
jgi:hypothetical protein